MARPCQLIFSRKHPATAAPLASVISPRFSNSSTGHTISQRLRKLKDIPPELIPLGNATRVLDADEVYFVLTGLQLPSLASPSSLPATPVSASSSSTRTSVYRVPVPLVAPSTTKLACSGRKREHRQLQSCRRGPLYMRTGGAEYRIEASIETVHHSSLFPCLSNIIFLIPSLQTPPLYNV